MGKDTMRDYIKETAEKRKKRHGEIVKHLVELYKLLKEEC